ncbi:MAG: phage tail assembly protein [Tistlia sp.]|uniref:phage tail assembly protein n=1 Tax=Tistlia sp. TaxID=3057121 RepID=UPI0034A42F40
MAGTTVKLTYPIEAHGKTLTELVLRRPTLGTLKHLKLSDNMTAELSGDDLISIVASLAGIPPSSAEQIDVDDLEEVGKAVAGFFEKSPPTGGTPSGR